MASKNNKEQTRKYSNTAKMFAKLDVDKDERLTRTPIETGRISHFFRTFKNNYSTLMLANLLFMLFALPAILMIFYFTPNLYRMQNAVLDFNGDMGIGFGGSFDIVKGMLNIYNAYEIMFYILVPCFAIMGIGMAGLFYVSRNLLWGAPVRIRVHFFRGIKKRWAEFLLAFTFLGGTVCMMGCSVLEFMKADIIHQANAGHYVFMIMSALVLLLTIIYLSVSLPMNMSFRFKFASVVKNSTILGTAMILPILVVLLFLAIPMLMFLSNFTKIVLYVAIAMIGFAFYVLAVSAVSQNIFDSTIIPLYEHVQRQKEKEEKREKDRQNRAKKSAKARGKKR